MNTRYLAAAVQMHSTLDKGANVATATRLVEQAAAQGAQLVVLPELFDCLGPMEQVAASAEPVPGPTSEAMSALARRLKIVLAAGTIAEQSAGGKAFNTSLVFGPAGELLSAYRKIHLFDIALPGCATARESDWMSAGEQVGHGDTPLGRMGQAICYDLRFPELFRRLADADCRVVLAPSAFMATTGRAHWEVLLRARAIENQAYVIAPNQFGVHAPQIETFGHSLIVDPWGVVLACVDEGEGLALAEIDLALVAKIRAELPALANRRLKI